MAAVPADLRIADFDRSANELERWIQDEQNRTRIHDPAHAAYSAFAQAMARRRNKLKLSIDALKRQLAEVASTAV
jgi:flagellar protein FliJ